MAKSGRFWIECASEYSTEDCSNVSQKIIDSINQYLQTMRVDDYKYLAEQKGIHYFRDALDTGNVKLKENDVVAFLKNLKNKDEIKTRVHEVVENIREIAINFSEEYKRDHKSENMNSNN